MLSQGERQAAGVAIIIGNAIRKAKRQERGANARKEKKQTKVRKNHSR